MTRPYRIYLDFALSEQQGKQQPVDDNNVTQFPWHHHHLLFSAWLHRKKELTYLEIKKFSLKIPKNYFQILPFGVTFLNQNIFLLPTPRKINSLS